MPKELGRAEAAVPNRRLFWKSAARAIHSVVAGFICKLRGERDGVRVLNGVVRKMLGKVGFHYERRVLF